MEESIADIKRKLRAYGEPFGARVVNRSKLTNINKTSIRVFLIIERINGDTHGGVRRSLSTGPHMSWKKAWKEMLDMVHDDMKKTVWTVEIENERKHS